MADGEYRRQSAYGKTDKGRATRARYLAQLEQKRLDLLERPEEFGGLNAPLPCAVCSSMITAPTHCGQKYCSSACAKSAQVARDAIRRRRVEKVITLICAHCDGGFSSAEAHASKRIYCSEACSSEARLLQRKAMYASAAYKRRQAERRQSPEAKAWFAAHKQTSEFRATQSLSKTKRRSAKAGGEKFDPYEIFDRDGWRCQICGVSTPKSRRGTFHRNAPELDHVAPLCKGGGHTRVNTQCACRQCNMAKSWTKIIGQVGLFTSLLEA